MECKIGVISGDGIGPEIVAEAKKVLDKTEQSMVTVSIMKRF